MYYYGPCAQGRQRDVNRELVPAVKESMTPAYVKGIAESGTGSHRRRVAIVEDHVEVRREDMFLDAIKPITGSLTAMVKEIGDRARTALRELPPVVNVNAGVMWMEDGAAGRAARSRLVAPFNVAACEARRALQQLVESQTGEAPPPAPATVDEEEADGILDVTAEAMAAKRAAEKASVIGGAVHSHHIHTTRTVSYLICIKRINS